jgi:hypothetical protein
LVYGLSAQRHPLVPAQNPVALDGPHSTGHRTLGIAPNTSYVTEGRPFYVTKDGNGKPIDSLLA